MIERINFLRNAHSPINREILMAANLEAEYIFLGNKIFLLFEEISH